VSLAIQPIVRPHGAGELGRAHRTSDDGEIEDGLGQARQRNAVNLSQLVIEPIGELEKHAKR
jgi:hypothetical protein